MENTLTVLATEFLENTGQHRVLAVKNDNLISLFDKAKAEGKEVQIRVYGKVRPISAIFVTDSNGVEIVKKLKDSKDGLVKVGTPLMQIFTKSQSSEVTFISEDKAF